MDVIKKDDSIIIQPEQEKPPAIPAGMHVPACAHCKQHPASISCSPFPIATPQARINTFIFFCGNLACNAIISVHIVSLDQPEIVGARSLPPNGLIRPS